jgi:dienelactone hydrolase
MNKGMSDWNLKTLRGNIKYRIVDTHGSIQEVLFESEPYLGRRTEVFAYLGVPPVENGQVPGMVCVHGGGGKAFKQWVEMWVTRGYTAIAIDLSGRDGRGDRLPNGGPEQDHEAKFSTTAAWQDMWTYHAVASVIRANSLLRSLSSVDPARIGITGISWGGYVTCIAAGVDSRFACAIPVYGCGFLQHNSADEWMKIFASMTPLQRQSWHDRCDPSVYLKNVKMPVLFVSGTNDQFYPLDSLEMSCALPTGPVSRCIRIGMAHGHEAGWEPREIGIFADQHLNNRQPLPAIEACVLNGNHISAGYSCHFPDPKGYFLYTRSRDKWSLRKWHSSSATLNNGMIEATLPVDVTACFMALEDDRGAYVNSPMVQIT